MSGHDVLLRDELGPPYVISGRISGLEDARRIARSEHPSRVVAITGGYRYARFTERGDGTVAAELMNSPIAVYSAGGVVMSTCGWSGPTTTEALAALAPPWVHDVRTQRGKVLMDGEPFPEGTLLPWRPVPDATAGTVVR